MSRWSLALALYLTICGCTSPSDTFQSTTEPSPTEQTTHPTTAVVTPGLSERTLAHDGETREYLLYVPDGYDGTVDLPLVINLHGFGGTARDQLRTSDMRALADEASFFLVYPQGTLLDGFTHWNTFLPGDDNKSEADDFGFIDALLDALEAELRLDARRVYATGFSNGGDFTYTLACFLDGRITGIAPVAGSMWVGTERDCTLTHPVPLLSIHGTADDVRPIGGYPGFLLSLDASHDLLRQHNGIPDAPTVSRLDGAGATVDRYDFDGGDGDVAMRHYRVVQGPHAWIPLTDDDLETDALIWGFLSQFDHDGRRSP